MEIDDGVVRSRKPAALSRRRFLGTAGAVVGSSWLAGLPGCSGRRKGLDQAPRKAVERRRRLILDDDGDLVYDPEATKGAEAFVDLRVKPILGTPVDSIAWCIMWGIAQGPGQTRYWETQQQNRPLNEAIHDPTPIMVEGIHSKGLEVFGSIRMNDTHDAFGMPEGKLVYPLKVAHPEWLLGERSQKGESLHHPGGGHVVRPEFRDTGSSGGSALVGPPHRRELRPGRDRPELLSHALVLQARGGRSGSASHERADPGGSPDCEEGVGITPKAPACWACGFREPCRPAIASAWTWRPGSSRVGWTGC